MGSGAGSFLCPPSLEAQAGNAPHVSQIKIKATPSSRPQSVPELGQTRG